MEIEEFIATRLHASRTSARLTCTLHGDGARGDASRALRHLEALHNLAALHPRRADSTAPDDRRLDYCDCRAGAVADVCWPCPTIRLIASMWSNHPHYDIGAWAWRPEFVGAGSMDPDEARLHSEFRHPDWEYLATHGPLRWLESEAPPGPDWERNIAAGRAGWERFDHGEVSYWRRKRLWSWEPDESDQDEPVWFDDNYIREKLMKPLNSPEDDSSRE